MTKRTETNSFIAFITIGLFFVCYMTFKYVSGYQETNGYRDVSGIVYDKLGKEKTHYKSTRVYTQFIMVIKDNDTGRYFDLEVTPTTFSTHEVGDKISFKHLSKDIIGEEYEDRSGLYILAFILGFLGLITLSCIQLN